MVDVVVELGVVVASVVANVVLTVVLTVVLDVLMGVAPAPIPASGGGRRSAACRAFFNYFCTFISFFFAALASLSADGSILYSSLAQYFCLVVVAP